MQISHAPSLHQGKSPVRIQVSELFCIFTPRYRRNFHKIPINKRDPSLFVHNIYMLRMTWSGIVRPSIEVSGLGIPRKSKGEKKVE